MDTFNPMPMSAEDRKKQQLAHAQQMLNIITGMGQFSVNALPQYNYGGQANQLGTDIGKEQAATLLMASGGGLGGPNYRTGALQRRLKRKS